MASIKKTGPVPQGKVTRADIDNHRERERKQKEGRFDEGQRSSSRYKWLQREGAQTERGQM